MGIKPQKHKHIHTWKIARRKGEYSKPPTERLWICTRQDCGAQFRGYQLLGKVAKCNSCGNSMEMTRNAMERAAPICNSCLRAVQPSVSGAGKYDSFIERAFKTPGTSMVETMETEKVQDLESIPSIVDEQEEEGGFL